MLLNERKLAIAASVIGLIGTIALFLLAEVTEAPLETVSGLDSGKARIRGIVGSVEIKEGYALLAIIGSEPLEAVSFDVESAKALAKATHVELTGEARSYKGRKSFVISKVKILGG